MNMKPQDFCHLDAIIMIKKNDNVEKKSEIPLRYNYKNKRNKTIQIMQKVLKMI